MNKQENEWIKEQYLTTEKNLTEIAKEFDKKFKRENSNMGFISDRIRYMRRKGDNIPMRIGGAKSSKSNKYKLKLSPVKLSVAGQNPAPEQQKSMFISASQFENKYDIYKIIETHASKIKQGQFILEQDFCKFSGIAIKPGVRMALSHSDFEKYRGKVSSNVVYWGNPVSIQEYKERGILS